MKKIVTTIGIIIVFVFIFCLALRAQDTITDEAVKNAQEMMEDVKKADADNFEKYKSNFDYDHSMPLNIEIKGTEPHPFYDIIRLSYEGITGKRVPAILYLPKDLKAHYDSLVEKDRKDKESKAFKLFDPPYPIAFYMHYLMGDKDEATMVAPQWAELGLATFAIDGVNRGERENKTGNNIMSTDIQEAANNLKQQITDIMRGIDYLTTRNDIDPNRIAFLGVSMGSITGAVACGVDERIKVIALADGAASLRAMFEGIQKMQVSDFDKIKAEIESKGYTLEKAFELIDPYDPIHFVTHLSPRPTILINGKYDEIIPFSAIEELHKAVGEPKKVIIYNSGHLLPLNQALYEVRKWLKKYL